MSRFFYRVFFIILMVPVFIFADDNLMPGEKVHVWVLGEPDLTLDCTIGQDGSIQFPLIGSAGISGMPPRDAAKLIAKMLDDGFLRNPMVQVARVSTKQGINLAPPQSTQIASHAQVVKGEPLKITKVPLFSSQLLTNSPVRIQIVDRKSGTGIPKAAMLLGGKIYQTNKSGEMTVQTSTGMMVLMADGYRILQSPIEVFIKAASKSKIIMEPLPFANEIKVQVVDGFTQKPLKDALIKLNQMRVKTNSKGLFRITDIATEFGEIEVSKNGYKTLKKTIDFKDPSERVFPLIPHE